MRAGVRPQLWQSRWCSPMLHEKERHILLLCHRQPCPQWAVPSACCAPTHACEHPWPLGKETQLQTEGFRPYHSVKPSPSKVRASHLGHRRLSSVCFQVFKPKHAPLHEALALGVAKHAALSARALRDEAARAVDACLGESEARRQPRYCGASTDRADVERALCIKLTCCQQRCRSCLCSWAPD